MLCGTAKALVFSRAKRFPGLMRKLSAHSRQMHVQMLVITAEVPDRHCAWLRRGAQDSQSPERGAGHPDGDTARFLRMLDRSRAYEIHSDHRGFVG